VSALLKVENLSVAFGESDSRVRVVNSVSFEVARGETLAIVGESGSGKSVTALSILRLLGQGGEIVDGRVRFGDMELSALSDEEIRRIRGNQISMIFQEPMTSLNPAMTIGRQVAEPLRIHRKLTWDEALEQAAQLLRRVSIPDARGRLKDYPHQFSGGMRQRVMIAMALACSPALVIADEPTTALDVTVQAQVLELLKGLTRELNSALILITHDLGVVAQYADKVVVMYAGGIVEAATAKDLYRNPQHPYTLGLMGSIPSRSNDPRSRLKAIKGAPPDIARLPKGCPFAPRCQHARAACMEARPSLRPVAGEGHTMACIGHD
jgi:oligopeptide transport system ATP-binding protein